jgi:hypothetical protein
VKRHSVQKRQRHQLGKASMSQLTPISKGSRRVGWERANGGFVVKRSLLILALAAVLLMTAVPAGAAPPEAANDQTWIVTLDPTAPAAEHAGRLVGPLGGSVQHVYRYVLNGFAFRGSEHAAEALERNPNVLRVEPNREVQMADEIANNGFFRIDADDTYYSGDRGKTPNGTSVRIAILDTGIMASHIDLAPNLDVSSSISSIASEPSGRGWIGPRNARLRSRRRGQPGRRDGWHRIGGEHRRSEGPRLNRLWL